MAAMSPRSSASASGSNGLRLIAASDSGHNAGVPDIRFQA
jgi:hypothetical protein